MRSKNNSLIVVSNQPLILFIKIPLLENIKILCTHKYFVFLHKKSMELFSKAVSIRWSDLDPNYHVRHSAYYDWGAQQRVEVLNNLGLSLKVMQENHFGPILFREECVFRKEIHMHDEVTISLSIKSIAEDGSRWTMQHVLTNQKGELCATITIDGAWIDTEKRKLANPTPEMVMETMKKFPGIDS